MMEFLRSWMSYTWGTTLEAAPWLLGGFLVAGVLHAWGPGRRMAAHLGRPGPGGVLKASLLGVPLPLCSCSVIPVASAMRRAGASRGATAGFLISTPETGVDSIAVTWALLGPGMALLRPAAAFLSALVAGLLIEVWDRSGAPGPAIAAAPVKDSCGSGCGCGSASVGAPEPRPGPGGRLRVALRYGFGEMFADLAVWLLIGFVLAGLISTLLPEGLFAGRLASGWAAMPLVLLVALPLYVCATSSTPIAAALVAKGMSPGTALVFLLAGPATNVTTMLVVLRELGRRSLAIYLASIAVVAVGLGLLVDFAFVLPVAQVWHVTSAGHHGHSPLETILAVVFTVLLANGLRLRYCSGPPVSRVVPDRN